MYSYRVMERYGNVMEKHLFKIYENSRFVVCIFDVIQMFPCFQPLYWAGISKKEKMKQSNRVKHVGLCVY